MRNPAVISAIGYIVCIICNVVYDFRFTLGKDECGYEIYPEVYDKIYFSGIAVLLFFQAVSIKLSQSDYWKERKTKEWESVIFEISVFLTASNLFDDLFGNPFVVHFWEYFFAVSALFYYLFKYKCLQRLFSRF